MKILNCEDLENTYKSLEEILGIKEFQFRLLFDDINIEGFYKREELFTKVRSLATSEEFDCVYWFHATRVPLTTDFSQGILPLQEVIELIWDFLYSLVKTDISSETWNEFKKYMNSPKVSQRNDDFGVRVMVFQQRTKKNHLCGPYASLIKDYILSSSGESYRKYLNKSEIIEDICICFDAIHNIDLKKKYQEHSKPCIVTFRNCFTNTNVVEEIRNKEKYLATAVYYLYSNHKKNEIDGSNFSDFDNKGVLVKQSDIIKVECIENLK